MQTLLFTPGRALLESSPTNRSWSLRFEDEGIAAYLYVCDRALGHGDSSILDSMLIYNVAALREAARRSVSSEAPSPAQDASGTVADVAPGTSASAPVAPDPNAASSDAPAPPAPAESERLAAIEWSRDGLQAVFYLDGTAQAMADFTRRISFCRSDFPNFLAEGNERWRTSSHAWDPAAIEQFEATLYA